MLLLKHNLNSEGIIQSKYEEFMEVMKFFKMIPESSRSINQYDDSEIISTKF